MCNPQVIEYSYIANSKPKTGQKIEYILVSQDSDEYCIGVLKRRSDQDKQYEKLTEKFKAGTI